MLLHRRLEVQSRRRMRQRHVLLEMTFPDAFVKSLRLCYAPTSALAGSTACTTRPRARASITPTARNASSVTVLNRVPQPPGIVHIVPAPAARPAIHAERAEQRGRCQRGVLGGQMTGPDRGIDAGGDLGRRFSRRLASREAVTSTSDSSARMPQASLRCDSTCTATVVDGRPPAPMKARERASAARRIAASSSRETSRSVPKSGQPWRGNSGRPCRRRHWARIATGAILHRGHAAIGRGIPCRRQDRAAAGRKPLHHLMGSPINHGAFSSLRLPQARAARSGAYSVFGRFDINRLEELNNNSDHLTSRKI